MRRHVPVEMSAGSEDGHVGRSLALEAIERELSFVDLFLLHRKFKVISLAVLKHSSGVIIEKHMSVEIILSSKQIELDQYNHAVLNMKALFASLPPAIVALYKVAEVICRSGPTPRIWST